MPLSHDEVIAALRHVKDPELFKDIVTLNMVKDVKINGMDINLTVELTTPNGPMKDVIEKDIRQTLKAIGAKEVILNLTAQTRGTSGPKREALPQVKNVIAVGAGKGGVGKSTIALNIAIGLQRVGATVGLMDGDIYGPSMPTMLGVKGVPSTVRGTMMLPHHVHGIHAITIGSLVAQDYPLIWRGPKAHGAFKQLLLDNTEWPELDYLVVDLPPGTGDVPLTLCQLLPLTGAVIVATPQQVALDDAIRAVRMFQQLGAPILGLVENMSYFMAPDGTEHDIFGRGGTARAADALGFELLGEVPIFTELRQNSDSGRPHANYEGSPKLRIALEGIVGKLAAAVSRRNMQEAPTLEIS